jgi:hypothetical protein
MIGDSVYRFEEVDSNLDDGEQVLVKITYVSLDSVVLTQSEDGIVTITEKLPEINDDDDETVEAPVPDEDLGNGKYRLEPEGDMFRVIATQSIPGTRIYQGAHGGLVANRDTLSRHGRCWVHRGAQVLGDMRVSGDAQVTSGCRLDGEGQVTGSAYLSAVTFTGSGYLTVAGDAQLDNVRISGGCTVRIDGSSYVRESHIEAFGDVHLSGCLVRDAHIRNEYEIVSIRDRKWGWLSAYRHESGRLQYSIGCRDLRTRQEMLDLAGEESVSDVHVEMLKAFFEVVEAAGAGWRDYVPPQPEVASQHVELTFGGMAQRARDAAQTLRAPQPEQF